MKRMVHYLEHLILKNHTNLLIQKVVILANLYCVYSSHDVLKQFDGCIIGTLSHLT